MNSGQALSQLECVEFARDTQKSLSLVLHALMQCFSPQVPQMSSVSGQLSTKCPHCLHFMHWMGLILCLDGLEWLPQILTPSLIILLAVSTELTVTMA